MPTIASKQDFPPWIGKLVSLGFGMILALIALSFIVMGQGITPGEALKAIYRFSLSDAGKIATILSTAIPRYLAGLAVAFAFRAGLFNIGVEGQYIVGGLTGALAGIYLDLPVFLHIPIVVCCAMIGGALWALIPTILKVKRGVHEVVTTIMFNSIATALMGLLVIGPLATTERSELDLIPQTDKIRETALFGKLNGFFRTLGWNVPEHVYLDYSLVIALLAGLFYWLFFSRLRSGFETRAIGVSPLAARYGGVVVDKVRIGVFLFSGALAGLVGLQEIHAIRGYYTNTLSSGVGFDGIAVALIGQGSALGIFLASLLFSLLRQLGYSLQFYSTISNTITYVLTAVIIFAILVGDELVLRYVRTLKGKRALLEEQS